MTSFAVALLVGELLSAWFAVGAPAAAIAALTLAGSLARVRRPIAVAARALAAAAIGAWLAGRALEPPNGCFVPAAAAAEKLWLVAEIEDAPTVIEDGGLRMRVIARAPGREPERICGSVVLTVSDPPGELSVGEKVRVHASLRRPRNFANPRAYDYRGSLARRGVWATARASGKGLVRIGGGEAGERSLASERQRIGKLIDASLPEPHAALLRSLVVGDQASIPAAVWDRIAAAGLAHLLSVSGLHIALVWGLVFALARGLLGRSEWLLLHLHVRGLAALTALPPAILYAALSGLSVPAARSVAMTALVVASLACGREVQPLRALCLAAAAVAVAWPGAPLEASFQLSFASVLALVLASDAWARRPRASLVPGWRDLLRDHVLLAVLVPAAALAGTAPLVALHFNRVTPIGLVTNPVLVPLTGTPATVLGLAGAAASLGSERLAEQLFALAYWPLEGLRAGAFFAAELPLATLRVPTPTLCELGLVYVLLALPWLPHERRRVVAALVLGALAADGAFWLRERRASGDLRARFVDVGQGDAAVLELPHGGVVVIDGGGFARSRLDIGERVLAPYLWSRKILRADVVVATHGDFDHRGGLDFVARELAPRELWVGARGDERGRLAALEREVRSHGGKVRPLVAGEELVVDGVRFECLHPPLGGVLSSNDSSLVLRIRFGAHTLLFTGDVEAGGEQAIAERSPPAPTTVLKVAHHGSATSSGDGFLRWAAPELAVISVGVGNGYGLPHPDVVTRYRRFRVPVLRTDRDGSVWVATDGDRMLVRPFERSSPPLCALAGVLC